MKTVGPLVMAEMKNDEPRPLMVHASELQRRIVWCAVFFVIFFLMSFFFARYFFDHLSAYVGKLVFLAPADAFSARLRMATFGAALLSLPFWLFHAGCFCAPAWPPRALKYLSLVIVAVAVVFYSGAFFGGVVAAPLALKFFLSFQTPGISPMLTIDSCLSLFMDIILTFGIVFEFPFVMVAGAKIGIVDAAWLRRYRRHVIVGAFVLSALLTPPDFISQLALALPLCALYEIGVWLVALSSPKE